MFGILCQLDVDPCLLVVCGPLSSLDACSVDSQCDNRQEPTDSLSHHPTHTLTTQTRRSTPPLYRSRKNASFDRREDIYFTCLSVTSSMSFFATRGSLKCLTSITADQEKKSVAPNILTQEENAVSKRAGAPHISQKTYTCIYIYDHFPAGSHVPN